MNANGNVIITWVQENIQRLFTKSPLFFKVWTVISVVLVLITGVPEFLSFISGAGIVIPDLWNAHITLAVAWASRAALFMSLLTTASKPLGVMGSGVVISVTDKGKLPFTVVAEKKSAAAGGVEKVYVTAK